MNEEIKRQFKDLMFATIMLATLLIFLSYIREYEDRITRLENLTKVIMRNDTTNYYEKLKGFESVRLERREIYESPNK